jgi:hypothetical protein
MEQATFNNLLDSKDIGWNDKVTLTILNPNYKRKWYDPFNWFGKPKTFTFTGYLNYFEGDDNVHLNIPVKFNDEIQGPAEFYMVFEFKDIIGLT